MDACKALERDLQDALNRLYDPQYTPSELLRTALGCCMEGPIGPVQQALIQAIKAMEPSNDVPATARTRRIFQVLAYRYLQGLTQEEAAERLGITPRHLRREQQRAVSVLAKHILARPDVVSASPSSPQKNTADLNSTEQSGTDLWRSQVRSEVAALHKAAPSGYTDVKESLQAILELGRTLALKHSVSLKLGTIQTELIAAVRQSALRQILIKTLSHLLQGMFQGEIELSAASCEGRIVIAIKARPAPEQHLQDYLIQELLTAEGGAITVRVSEGEVLCNLSLPHVTKTTVLVIDDNTDLVHFYRRYTEGTRYQIVHLTRGEKTIALAEELKPEVIVLDVMLPDIDGWELLSQLHEHPFTRSIPVIVCSVVGEEDLALALGAKIYLSKPVRRQQFLQALDQAVN